MKYRHFTRSTSILKSRYKVQFFDWSVKEIRGRRTWNEIDHGAFIHSFIHSGCLYSTPSRNLLRGALSPAKAKEICLKKPADRRQIVPGQQAQGKTVSLIKDKRMKNNNNNTNNNTSNNTNNTKIEMLRDLMYLR